MKKLIRIGLLLLVTQFWTSALLAQSVTANITSTTCTGNTFNATGCVSMNVSGQAGIGIQVSGTFSATLVVEAITDATNGSFVTMPVNNFGTSQTVSTITGTGIWTAPIGGLNVIRVRATAYTSGTAVVTMLATDGATPSPVLIGSSALHSHTTAATITIAAPTGGQFVYIDGWDVVNCAGATAVTAAAPTFITTTNLPGSPQLMAGSGTTAGQCQSYTSPNLVQPLKASAANVAVTFVLPAFATNQTLSVNVYYHYGF